MRSSKNTSKSVLLSLETYKYSRFHQLFWYWISNGTCLWLHLLVQSLHRGSSLVRNAVRIDLITPLRSIAFKKPAFPMGRDQSWFSVLFSLMHLKYILRWVLTTSEHQLPQWTSERQWEKHHSSIKKPTSFLRLALCF
jgi:hypothetical protein